MNKLGKCPDCPQGTKDVLLIAGKCSYHFRNPVEKKGKSVKELEEVVKKPSKTVKKARKPINKRSKKKIQEDRQYSKLQPEFLKEHPFCEIKLPGCRIHSNQVHHTKGRGKYYLVVSTWKASCDPCHKHITIHSKKAIEDGHSQRRNGPKTESSSPEGLV